MAFSARAQGSTARHERVGTRELATARHDPRFARWEIGLSHAGAFHEIVEERLVRRGFVVAAGDQVVLETAKAFVIRQRIGSWAIKYLDAGRLYYSPLEVSHSVDNFVRSPEGRRCLYNVPLTAFVQDSLPMHPLAESITGRPPLPPDRHLLRKEFRQIVEQNRSGLTPREQKLFDLLRSYAPFSNERGGALRRFSQEEGISTKPGSVHRWIKKLQRKLLQDVRLNEILAEYFGNRTAQVRQRCYGLFPLAPQSGPVPLAA